MKYTFPRHQILNITTAILWTKMEDIYKFFEVVSGQEGIMTHSLPRARKAFMSTIGQQEPFNLMTDIQYAPTDVPNDEISIEISDEDTKAFWKAYDTEI